MTITLEELQNFKNKKQKLSAIATYSYPMAKVADEVVEIILVGDSLGMTLYGLDSTTEVTIEMMINHGKAVKKACKDAFLVVDMPFGTYENSPEIAFENATRIVQETGCDAVKLEGGVPMASTIDYLTNNNIVVVGHIGLLPQSAHLNGGYKIQRNENKIVQDAVAIEKAGCKIMVIEGVTENIANLVCESIDAITIGIGASSKCDGQILVMDDILGFNEKPAKFVKLYENLPDKIKKALIEYKNEISTQKFPSDKNCY